MTHEELTLTINGTKRTAQMPKGLRLLDALRRLGYSGTKEGCGEGECVACTVLFDGRPVNSCILFAKQAVGHELVTVEGVGRGRPSGLHPFQRALVELGGVQCGFCTPGIVVAGAALVDARPGLSASEAREALSGNLCRCTGYKKIVDAAVRAALEVKP
jgi:carbon-monoxide dehydrogenase small subunit